MTTPKTEWTVGYYLSNGNIAVVAGSPRFANESHAVAESGRRNREKPFIEHIAVRA